MLSAVRTESPIPRQSSGCAIFQTLYVASPMPASFKRRARRALGAASKPPAARVISPRESSSTEPNACWPARVTAFIPENFMTALAMPPA
ncbi:hypothetical protein G6F55_014449 [Rhizopus delemar]|nr:hypothetical protein G6F55_014449 [Rhizopus delemar]